MDRTTYFRRVDSPVGPLLLTWERDALTRLVFIDDARGSDRIGAGWRPDDGRLEAAVRQLEEYFAGTRTAFDLPLAPAGTPFQQRVWRALLGIGFGETVSYGEVAARIGHPGAARAVGHANGRNPIGIVIPCHRVIAAGGALGGYSAGLERKRFLLNLEARVAGAGLADAA